MGPVLSKTSSSESIVFMKDIIKGKFATGVPSLTFGYVDVRDVAMAHITASENQKVNGRHILVNDSFKMFQITTFVKELYGKKFKLPKSETPKWLMVLIGPLFGVTRKFIRRNVGYSLAFDNTKSKKEMGMQYTPIKNTVKDMIESLSEN